MVDQNLEGIAPESTVAPEQNQSANNVETGTNVQAEKVLKQSEVNKIVSGVKLDAYERGKRDAAADAERLRAAQNLAPEHTTSDANTSTIDKVTLSKAELRQIIAEEANAQAQQKRAEEVVGQFVNKMQLGMQKYPDFEEVVTQIDIPNLPPPLIDMLNSVDNTADIMYDIANNPSKFAYLVTLSEKDPRFAQKQFMKLSNSIKKNEQVGKQNANANVKDPLDQLKPSTASTENGNMTVKDFCKQDWLRG